MVNTANTEPAGVILDHLASLPDRTLLDVAAMAAALGVCTKTVRSMADRGELPPPVTFAGRSMWFSGRVLAWVEAEAQAREREADQHRAKIRTLGA
jgi:predicted DNA-binding transcriptional regulator AlpA